MKTQSKKQSSQYNIKHCRKEKGIWRHLHS